MDYFRFLKEQQERNKLKKEKRLKAQEERKLEREKKVTKKITKPETRIDKFFSFIILI